jgi:hypothetical protein
LASNQNGRENLLPRLFGRLSRPILHHFNDPRLLEIRHQCDLGLLAPKALLIHPQTFHRIQLTPFQTSLHRPTHHPAGSVSNAAGWNSMI